MPEARIKLPDGRTAIVRADTRDDLMQKVERVTAGMSAGPNIAQADAQALQRQAQGTSAGEAALIGAGSAFNDVGENLNRAGQWIGERLGLLGANDRAAMDQRLSQDDQAFQALQAEHPVSTTVGRTGAQIAMTAPIPGGVAGGMLTRMATGAAAGGVTGALTSGPDDNPYASFTVGALAGAAAPLVVAGISRAVTALAKKPMQVMVDGKFTDEALEFLKSNNIAPNQLSWQTANELRRVGALTKDQAERFNLFREFDPRMNPTQAQLTQSADDFVKQQELFKTSTAVRETLDQQERVIRENVDAWISRAGGQARDSVDASNVLAQAVQRRINAADEAIDAGYKAVREALPTEKAIKPGNLVARLREFASQDQSSGGLVGAVWGDLQRRGVLGKGGRLQGRIDAETAEEVRKTINAIVRENPQMRSRIGTVLKDAIDEDVAAAVGDDLFRPVRQAKATLERSLERARVTRRDFGGDSLLETVISNRANPDDLVPKILRRSTRTEDVKQLVAFLSSGSADDIAAGRQALAELRSATIRELYEKSAFGKTEDGLLMFSGKAFAKQMDAIGQSKLEALFDPQTLTDLGALRRIGELRTPVQGTALGLGPSGQAGMEVRSAILNAADEATGRFVRLTQKLLGARKDLAEIRQILEPARTTPGAIRAAEAIRVRPFAGSVGAVTADRWQEGSEE